jgi:hypothetical protein
MSLLITLDVFSGRPNPHWLLRDEEERAFRSMIEAGGDPTPLRPSGSFDFHWYRQDEVGCWSHKPGGTLVRDSDNGGNRITDPQLADRGPYTDFCTNMVTRRQVQIR